MFCYFLFPCIVNPLFTVRTNYRFIAEILFFWAGYVVCFLFENVIHSNDYISAHLSPLNKLFLFMMGAVYASQAIVNNGVVKSPSYLSFWSTLCNLLTILMALYFVFQVIVGYETTAGGKKRSYQAFNLFSLIIHIVYLRFSLSTCWGAVSPASIWPLVICTDTGPRIYKLCTV